VCSAISSRVIPFIWRREATLQRSKAVLSCLSPGLLWDYRRSRPLTAG
jgi:hypothetical protein